MDVVGSGEDCCEGLTLLFVVWQESESLLDRRASLLDERGLGVFALFECA